MEREGGVGGEPGPTTGGQLPDEPAKAIQEVCTRIGVGDDVLKGALANFADLKNHDSFARRPNSVVICTAVYAAIREHGEAISLDEFADVSTAEKGRIASAFADMRREFNIRCPARYPDEFLRRQTSNWDLPERVTDTAMTMLHILEEEPSFSGKNPEALAASAVYAACSVEVHRVTINEVADRTGVAEGTIRDLHGRISDTYCERTSKPREPVSTPIPAGCQQIRDRIGEICAESAAVDDDVCALAREVLDNHGTEIDRQRTDGADVETSAGAVLYIAGVHTEKCSGLTQEEVGELVDRHRRSIARVKQVLEPLIEPHIG